MRALSRNGRVGVGASVMAVFAGVVMAASLLMGSQDAAAKAKDARPLFYMTPDQYDGSQALTACDAGFHMASLTEILNPTALRYDTTRGHFQSDSGGGAPHTVAWIRTGMFAVEASTPGHAMCVDDAGTPWGSNETAKRGTLVRLLNQWAASDVVSPIAPYVGDTEACSQLRRVWCVQD